MKLKYEFVMTEIGEDTIAVPVGDKAQEFSGVIKVNSTASRILELLQEDTTRDAIIKKLCTEYEDKNNSIASAVDSFIENLRENGLLTE